MAEIKKFSDTLVNLITGTNTVSQNKLDEAVKSAKSMNVPLERALIMLGHASEHTLRSVVEAKELIQEGKLSLEMALKALKFAKQNHLELHEAINVLDSVRKSQGAPTVTNDLTRLLLESGVITQDQLSRAITKASDSGMQLTRILGLNRDISSWLMLAALQSQILVRDGKINREQAIEALQTVSRRRISIEQSVFELGLYREPSGQVMKIGELCQMAGFMSESDMLECLEIEIVKEKQFGQILIEQGIITPVLLETAVYLQDMVANDALRAYQAAEALRQVRNRDVSVYQALAELQPPPQITPPTYRIAELLERSEVVTAEQIAEHSRPDETSSIRVGKRLLAATLVSEATLYAVLRTYSLLREGYISNDQAVQVLQHAERGAMTIDEALVKLNISVPARMQWIWT